MKKWLPLPGWRIKSLRMSKVILSHGKYPLRAARVVLRERSVNVAKLYSMSLERRVSPHIAPTAEVAAGMAGRPWFVFPECERA